MPEVKKKPDKARKHSVVISVDRILELLAKQKTIPEIKKIVIRESGKSASQVDRYFAEAMKQIKDEGLRDVATKRLEFIEGLRADMMEVYRQYDKQPNPKWMKLILEIKDRLASIEPNGLRLLDDLETKPTEYNFTFNEIKKEPEND